MNPKAKLNKLNNKLIKMTQITEDCIKAKCLSAILS